MEPSVDLSALAELLSRHDMGVDDLFFVLHLGAERVAHNQNLPPSMRKHWLQIVEECRGLWQDHDQSGQRLNPSRPAQAKLSPTP